MTNEIRRRQLERVLDVMRARRAVAPPEQPVRERTWVAGAHDPDERTWVVGAHDPDFDHATRERIHSALTDVRLIDAFERIFGYRDADYHEVVRALGYVWKCARDGTINVTGFCCATCCARYADADVSG